MQRAFDLARLGAEKAAPNPMVGAVIVYNDRIIGEGWFKEDGTSHAEVNAVASVQQKDRHLLKEATMYVSLEPCTIFGRTPPCTNLIIKEQIPKVVISTVDHTEGVNGTSQAVLEAAGCEVITQVLPQKGKNLAKIRNTFVREKRPYIILKYAQTADGFMGQPTEQIWLTNPISKRLVHKWRSEVDAILVGTNTAKIDNPKLNNRLYFGKSPTRIVLDKNGSIPKSHHLMSDNLETWIFTQTEKNIELEHKKYINTSFDAHLMKNILDELVKKRKSSLLVEGGAVVLQHFIDQHLWDECRIFTTPTHLVSGVKAPMLEGNIQQKYSILDNELTILTPKS